MTPDTDPKDAALHDLVKDWEQKVGSGRPWSRDMTVALVDRLIAERKALREEVERLRPPFSQSIVFKQTTELLAGLEQVEQELRAQLTELQAENAKLVARIDGEGQ